MASQNTGLQAIDGKTTELSDAPELILRPVGFRQGLVATPEAKYARIAIMSASLLTLVALGCGSLGIWRVSADPGWTKDFAIRKGFLSHWQVWIGAAIGIQYTSWWLIRYAGTLRSGVGSRKFGAREKHLG